MHRLQVALWGACAAIFINCGDGPIQPTTQEEPEASVEQRTLSENRRRFEEGVGSSYTYEFQRICFCPEDIRLNVRVTVEGGARTSVESVEDGSPVPSARWSEFLTINEIFDDIQTALDEGAASVQVEYDEALGYPRDVFIDVDQLIADEERGYTVRNLAPLR